MINSYSLLIDVLSILPREVDCYIQAPSLEDSIILKMMKNTDFEYFKLITITSENREIFLNQIKKTSAHDYFHNIQIKISNKLLFEGYDGVEYGILSNSINIPDWFKKEYIIENVCTVSSEW
jgi:hypothetical protein